PDGPVVAQAKIRARLATPLRPGVGPLARHALPTGFSTSVNRSSKSRAGRGPGRTLALSTTTGGATHDLRAHRTQDEAGTGQGVHRGLHAVERSGPAGLEVGPVLRPSGPG